LSVELRVTEADTVLLGVAVIVGVDVALSSDDNDNVTESINVALFVALKDGLDDTVLDAVEVDDSEALDVLVREAVPVAVAVDVGVDVVLEVNDDVTVLDAVEVDDSETLDVPLTLALRVIVAEFVSDTDGEGEYEGVTEAEGVADGFWMACKYPSFVFTNKVPSMPMEGPVLILHEAHNDCTKTTAPPDAAFRQ
jgi:hypothetical protein